MIFGGNPQSLVAGLQACSWVHEHRSGPNRTEPFLGLRAGVRLAKLQAGSAIRRKTSAKPCRMLVNSWAETLSPEFQRSASNNRVLVEQFQKDIRENDPTLTS